MSQIALITGGSRGIGYGIAHHLARDGLDLAICGVRDASAVKSDMNTLRDLGVEVLYCQRDISNPPAREELIADVKGHFSKLDVLINNAGVASKERKDLLEVSEESFERVLRVNLQGPYFLTQSVANWMIDQKRSETDFRGCIVNITSISSTVVSPDRGEYCVSKAGLSMATQLWAVRLAEFDIPVYEVRPGVVKSDMTAAVKAKYDKLISEGLLLQSRWGLPEDVGKSVAMLVRGELSYSTGQVITVDGGLTVPRL